MKRRDFMKMAAAGTAGAVAGSVGMASVGSARTRGAGAAAAQAEGRMVVGCQSRDLNKEGLEFLARHGVYHMDPGEPRVLEDRRWDLDDARRGVTVQLHDVERDRRGYGGHGLDAGRPEHTHGLRPTARRDKDGRRRSRLDSARAVREDDPDVRRA